MPGPEVMDQAAAAFGMLASPTRLQIVWILAGGECDVTGLAEQVGGTLPAVSQHLAKLRLAGLVRSRREGRRQVYLVDDPYLAAVVRLMVSQLSAQEQDVEAESDGPGLSAVSGTHPPKGLARGHIV
ncbi:ArsR/SmtB family transcription factor [Streptacidiphilus melanogenes]|uniref:ArsR/SmtB family transcription factor n=1 Tax=Streptacidiphilus melanogenes TaxID=411235 RepID=UPI00126A4BE9|nr:metalloregulator ArsR/SmtB family transcription factor [Streptacidiphilus melanogenes]